MTQSPRCSALWLPQWLTFLFTLFWHAGSVRFDAGWGWGRARPRPNAALDATYADVRDAVN